MATQICIEIDDDGTISVGQKPDDDESGDASASADTSSAQASGDQASSMTDLSQAPAADDETAEQSYMQPVKSIAEALTVARGLLQKAMPTGGPTMGGEPGGEGAQAAADAAFKSRRGAKAGF